MSFDGARNPGTERAGSSASVGGSALYTADETRNGKVACGIGSLQRAEKRLQILTFLMQLIPWTCKFVVSQVSKSRPGAPKVHGHELQIMQLQYGAFSARM